MTLVTWFRKTLADWGLEYFNRFYGVYRGYVHSIDDPKKLGRIQLSVPQIYGEDYHDFWATGRGMYAAQNAGFWLPPKKGDCVYVTFENGDPSYPIWEHGWFTEKQQIEEINTNYGERTILKTREGHIILIDDKEHYIEVTLKDGASINIHETRVSVNASELIELGTSVINQQPAVLGDNNEQYLLELTDTLTNLHTQIITLAGAVVPNPTGAGAIAKVLTELGTKVIKLGTLQQTVTNTKSKKVKIDG